MWNISQNVNDNHILVSEIDREALRKGIDSVLQPDGHYYAIGSENLSINLERFAGHYFALKRDLGCQIVDIASYAALKHSNPTTDFGRKIASYFDLVKERFIENTIIWLDNPDKTVHLPKRTCVEPL